MTLQLSPTELDVLTRLSDSRLDSWNLSQATLTALEALERKGLVQSGPVAGRKAWALTSKGYQELKGYQL